MLQESYGLHDQLSQWVIASLPMVLLALLVAPFVLRFCFRREEVQFASARSLLERSVRDMGRANRRQWTVGIVVVLTIAAWMALGDRIDLAIISIFGAATLFATRAISWEEAEKRIFWNIVLMYGGAIALGVAIDRTGAARWLVETYMAGVTIPPLLAVAAASSSARCCCRSS